MLDVFEGALLSTTGATLGSLLAFQLSRGVLKPRTEKTRADQPVARALANIAAAAENHSPFMGEGAFALCLDLVVSNSAEVQQQATRAPWRPPRTCGLAV